MDNFSHRPTFQRSPVYWWSMPAFLIFGLLSFLDSRFFFLALVAWLVGFTADRLSRRSFNKLARDFQISIQKKRPGIFQVSPPSNLNEVSGESVDVYDLQTGLYIGRCAKCDIRVLYDAFEDYPSVFENGPNDIPLTQDFINQVSEMEALSFTPHFMKLMDNAMDKKHLTLLTIRWTHPANTSQQLHVREDF